MKETLKYLNDRIEELQTVVDSIMNEHVNFDDSKDTYQRLERSANVHHKVSGLNARIMELELMKVKLEEK